MQKAKPEISGAKQERASAASDQPSTAAPTRRKRGRPARAESAPPHAAANSQPFASPAKTPAVLDLTEKAKELIRLAREQGHLTYEDVNDALSEDVVTPDDLDRILTKLRTLDIDIIDP